MLTLFLFLIKINKHNEQTTFNRIRIVQTHKPAVVDGEQIRFLRFFGPELLFEAERSSLAKNTEALHAQLKKEIHHGKNIESAITRIKT